jgi:transcriptional regulator with XRE-family HTH domain
MADSVPCFADNLRWLRRGAGVSREELAFRSEIRPNECKPPGEGDRLPRFMTLIKLAGALGVSPAALTDGIAWEPVETGTGRLVVTVPDDDKIVA